MFVAGSNRTSEMYIFSTLMFTLINANNCWSVNVKPQYWAGLEELNKCVLCPNLQYFVDV